GHRRLGVAGTATLTAGACLMTFIGAESSQAAMMVYIGMMGVGMGLSIPAFLVAVQTGVERRHLGAATSTIQFSRSIGGALGVSVMGAALSARLASNLSAAGLDPRLVSQLLDPPPGAEVVVETAARLALADAIHIVFVIAFIAALFGLAAVFFTPRGALTDGFPEAEIPR
ncbi:MAG: MFS transporter, partial [Chloroflexi bacterium]|nr:MFS transporter [Chloroflexota bacterium]